ncbi:MAG: helix-hairpin-helix domain-containing protein, partial [Chroococcales cyanobacterium]
MLDSSNWLKKTPQWVWWSFFPAFGGLAIAYAGRKSNTPNWLWLGLGLTSAGIILASTELGIIIWIAQIAIAFSIRKPFLIKTSPRGMLISDTQTAELVAEIRGKVDINNCSKDQLVYELGLPIVYANDIEMCLHEGYIFTYLEELSDIVGIPENYLKKIAPLVTFTYDYKKESDYSWRRLNSLSVQELVSCGLDTIVAQRIVEERLLRGTYNSVVDVKRRT